MTNKKFIIVVDIQNDFMLSTGLLSVAGASELIQPIEAYLEQLDAKSTAGVLFTYDTHTALTYPGSAEAQQFPPHCYRDTDGWQLAVPSGIVPNGIPVFTLEKGVFSMWEHEVQLNSTRDESAPQERDSFFRALRASGISTITVLGVASDYCIRWTIDGLLARGFEVQIPQGLTKGIAQEMPEVVSTVFAAAPVSVV